MVTRLRCTRCSFIFEIDAVWSVMTVAPSAPVHPVYDGSGKVTWRLCPGSGKQGIRSEEPARGLPLSR
jgi:hypothetical protein